MKTWTANSDLLAGHWGHPSTWRDPSCAACVKDGRVTVNDFRRAAGLADPLRPPETDEEPWSPPDADDPDRGAWLGAALLLAALLVGVVIGRAL